MRNVGGSGVAGVSRIGSGGLVGPGRRTRKLRRTTRAGHQADRSRDRAALLSRPRAAGNRVRREDRRVASAHRRPGSQRNHTLSLPPLRGRMGRPSGRVGRGERGFRTVRSCFEGQSLFCTVAPRSRPPSGATLPRKGGREDARRICAAMTAESQRSALPCGLNVTRPRCACRRPAGRSGARCTRSRRSRNPWRASHRAASWPSCRR